MNFSENAITVLNKRYLKRDVNGKVLEKPEDLFLRVAENIAMAENEDKREAFAKKFYDMMWNGQFLPNSPTLMNAGRGLQQLSGCFVLPVPDDMEGIFNAIKYMSLVQKSGGGTGFSFSRLRPTGSPVKGTNGVSSGPVSFMTVFNSATDVIKQGGTRRGASIAVLRIDHPDIEEFIDSKLKEGKISNFNISVGITEKFMDAVKQDKDFDLCNPKTGEVVKTIHAPDLYRKIVYNAWKNGEPGVLFLDKINDKNPTPHLGKIESSNPCLTGNTLVAVADSRNYVPIKQLAKEGKDIPVFCEDDIGRIKTRVMRRPRKTGEKVEVFKVMLDNGNSIEATSNHKFILSDGNVIKLKDLSPGDSLSKMTKRYSTFNKILKHFNSKSKDYCWINTTKKQQYTLEHRLIANHFHGKIGYKSVIHHIDGNGLNNDPNNLKVMSKKDHDHLHSIEMIGKNNPIYKLKREGKFEEYKARNKFYNTKGKNNPRYGVELTQETKEKISIKAKKRNKDPKYRERLSNSSKDAWVTKRDNFMKGFAKRSQDKLLSCQELTDLECYLENNHVMVKKVCEGCDERFSISWSLREISFCSQLCSLNMVNTDKDIKKKRIEGLHVAYESKMQNTKQKQLKCYSDLKFKLDRIPLLKEWREKCKNNNIPFRLGTKFGFSNFKELKEEAITFNCRVLSIEQCGYEDVYNGTVDEFHNFYIGKFEGEVEGDKSFSSILNLQCGEVPLLSYESCNLGSINLNLMLNDDNTINEELLVNTVQTAVRFLDNIITMNSFPIDMIKEATLKTRKIGLGVMGFHDMLIHMRIPYASERAVEMAKKVMSIIQKVADATSQELAGERGEFPAFAGSDYDKRGDPLIRNATRTSIAPTGTLSMIADCSSGIEPLFALVYRKNVLDNESLLYVNPLFKMIAKKEGFYSDELMEEITNNDGSVQGIDSVPQQFQELFKTANEIEPVWHIKIQAAFQHYIDNAVSKTINMPFEATEQDVYDAYMLANQMECKGLTVYRDGCRNVQVYDSRDKTKVDGSGVHPERRPETLQGFTTRVETGCGHLYVIINELNGKPFEVFATMGKTGGCAGAQSEGICRQVSLSLRSGVAVQEVAHQLRGITCTNQKMDKTRPGFWIRSCPDGIHVALQRYLSSKEDYKEDDVHKKSWPVGMCEEDDCDGTMVREGICDRCLSCGKTTCGKS